MKIGTLDWNNDITKRMQIVSQLKSPWGTWTYMMERTSPLRAKT